MLGYDFEIIYQLGCMNKTADPLYRNSKVSKELQSLSMVKLVGMEKL